MTSKTDEVEGRVDAAYAIADAMAIMAHQADATEYLLAGLASTGGPDLGPRQACRLSITYLALSSAANSRALAVGDADFAQRMLSPAITNWADGECAAWLSTAFQPATVDDVRQQVQFLDELGLLARSHGETAHANLLEQGVVEFMSLSSRPWAHPANDERLEAQAASPLHRPDMRQSGTDASAGTGGCLLVVLMLLTLAVVGVVVA